MASMKYLAAVGALVASTLLGGCNYPKNVATFDAEYNGRPANVSVWADQVPASQEEWAKLENPIVLIDYKVRKNLREKVRSRFEGQAAQELADKLLPEMTSKASSN